MTTAMGLIAFAIVVLGFLVAARLDDLHSMDTMERLADEIAERERLRLQIQRDAEYARRREAEMKASQASLARMGYYRGPMEGPGAGVAGAHHREAVNAWAKDVWAGIRAPHGSPERKRLGW